MALPPAPDDASQFTSDRRWRVLLVRVPESVRADIETSLPGRRRLRPSDLPLVVRTTGDEWAAEATARRLRQAGAVVLLIEEPVDAEGAFCRDHPAWIAAQECVVCAAPVCPSCRVEAGGEQVCVSCRRKGRAPGMRVRRRQLFVVFLFAVFLYQVVEFLRTDREAVDPQGHVRVAVFQFVPSGESSAPIIRELNRTPMPGEPPVSLTGIAAWFNEERVRYGGSRNYLSVMVHGPWETAVEPPKLDDPELSAWRLSLRAWEYARYFKQLALGQGVDPDEYAARVYVVYSRDAADLASHSRGSEQGRVAVVYVDLDERNPGYAAVTVAHELAHTLGADDLYDPQTMLSVHPEGYVEPFADPLFPQRFAELMAADIPVGPRREREVRSLEEVRLGYASAAAMGWIDSSQADIFYQPASLSPEERLGAPQEPAVEVAALDPEPLTVGLPACRAADGHATTIESVAPSTEGRLALKVTYRGGCTAHDFRLCWPERSFVDATPPRATLELLHTGPEDSCDAMWFDELELDVRPMAEAWRAAYPDRSGELLLQLGDHSTIYRF